MTHSDFLDAAMRIVDAEGLDALTFRRLGEEIGVSYTAVYTYFESRQDLVEELAGPALADGGQAEETRRLVRAVPAWKTDGAST